jgi:hypothetical protein
VEKSIKNWGIYVDYVDYGPGDCWLYHVDNYQVGTFVMIKRDQLANVVKVDLCRVNNLEDSAKTRGIF